MLETLLKLLRVHNAPAPEIHLEDDDDLGLSFYDGNADISITISGKVAWAVTGGRHGTDLQEFIDILEKGEQKEWK